MEVKLNFFEALVVSDPSVGKFEFVAAKLYIFPLLRLALCRFMNMSGNMKTHISIIIAVPSQKAIRITDSLGSDVNCSESVISRNISEVGGNVILTSSHSTDFIFSAGDQRARCCSTLGLAVTGVVALIFLFISTGFLVKYRARLKLVKGT